MLLDILLPIFKQVYNEEAAMIYFQSTLSHLNKFLMGTNIKAQFVRFLTDIIFK